MGSTSTIFSRPDLLHSKVGKPGATRGGKKQEGINCDWQFGQRGRGMDMKSEDDCSAGMTLPSIGGSTTLSVTGDT
jgi:hypothetical protein